MTVDPPLRLAVLQRVCPPYRIALFSALSRRRDIDFMLLIGDDLPHSKVRSAPDLNGVRLKKLRTTFIEFAGRTLPYHANLASALHAFQPDAILCEGESHLLGYLAAIYYRFRYNRDCVLLHWCFIQLPGEGRRLLSPATWFKAVSRRFFDNHVVYSQFSRSKLIERGVAPDRIHVATNVGDVERIVAIARQLAPAREELKRQLFGLAEFVVLYVGTLELNKRPELLLQLASLPGNERVLFVLCGDGAMRAQLETQVTDQRLGNVELRGNVSKDLVSYLVAADVLLVPGRGGIVVSEAMAAGLPVIAHQGDGTERDLVISGKTGIRVSDGSCLAFSAALKTLYNDRQSTRQMGQRAQTSITAVYSTSAMVASILGAVQSARGSRRNHRILRQCKEPS